MQGAWTLTEWRAVGIADTSQTLDLLAELSVVATLDVFPDDSATLTASLYGQSPSVEHAFLSLRGDTLSYDAINNHGRFLLRGSGDDMIWQGIVPQLQDVTGDGVPDQTLTRMAFRRIHAAVAQMMH